MGAGPARWHVASWRTTPTTWPRATEKILGAHMLEVCPSHRRRPSPACEIHPLGIGGREDPVRLVFDADPGAGGRRRRCATWATGSGSWPTRSSVVAPRRRPAEPARRPRRVAPGPGPAHLGRGVADRRRPAPHGAHHGPVRRAPVGPVARCVGTELALIDSDNRHPPTSSRSCGGTRRTTAWPWASSPKPGARPMGRAPSHDPSGRNAQ